MFFATPWRTEPFLPWAAVLPGVTIGAVLVPGQAQNLTQASQYFPDFHVQ